MKSKLSARLARSRSRRNQEKCRYRQWYCWTGDGQLVESSWSRLGSEVTVESFNSIGDVGIDEETSCILAIQQLIYTGSNMEELWDLL